jgi:hypothetical protein
MRLEGEVLFETHSHSSPGISFIGLRVRRQLQVGDVVRGSDTDTPVGNNHVGVFVVVIGGGE